MSNSPLATYTRLSPHFNPRNRKIDTITIHCVVGQLTAKQILNLDRFDEEDEDNNDASCNYAIGCDGSIGLCVEEHNRSWCTSSKSNDHRAITIEVASDTYHPYRITDAAYRALIDLCVDICKRNDFDALRWKGDKSLIGQVDKQNMTVHRWFAKKACPGDYLYNLHGQIAAEVNSRLKVDNQPSKSEEPKPVVGDSKESFKVQVLVDKFPFYAEPSKLFVSGLTNRGVFTIVETDGDWGKLKSGAGWIFMGNPLECRVIKDTDEELRVPFKVRVNIPDLNIRTGAGTNYSKTGEYTKVGIFTIVEVREGKGSDTGWGRLKSGAGWISLDHTERL